MIQTETIKRKLEGGEDPPHMDKRLLDTWVQNHPTGRIISCMHTNAYLIVIYEEAEQAA